MTAKRVPTDSQIDQLVEDIAGADIVIRSQYILAGEHVLQVIGCKLIISQNKGKNTKGNKVIITEFKVLASTNPDMSEGQHRAWILNMDKNSDTTMGNFKQMLFALIGDDNTQPKPEDEVKALIKGAISSDQLIAGIPVFVEGWNKETDKGVFTNFNWKHLPEDALGSAIADIQQRRKVAVAVPVKARLVSDVEVEDEEDVPM